MFDKLHLNGATPPREGWLKSIEASKVFWLKDRFFKQAVQIEFEAGEVLTVKWNPEWGHVSPVNIELNPSRWESWKRIIHCLDAITNSSELKIDRIDLAVDLAMSFEVIHECVRVKSKQNGKTCGHEAFENARGVYTGHYFGAKPEVIVVYDLAYHATKNKNPKFKKISGACGGYGTRFEVRLYGRKVPFKQISEIERYLDINPFSGIEYSEIRADASCKKADALRALMKGDGYHVVYHRLNSQNNFKRTLGKYLIHRDLALELHQVYLENLGKFLLAEGHGEAL